MLYGIISYDAACTQHVVDVRRAGKRLASAPLRRRFALGAIRQPAHYMINNGRLVWPTVAGISGASVPHNRPTAAPASLQQPH